MFVVAVYQCIGNAWTDTGISVVFRHEQMWIAPLRSIVSECWTGLTSKIALWRHILLCFCILLGWIKWYLKWCMPSVPLGPYAYYHCWKLDAMSWVAFLFLAWYLCRALVLKEPWIVTQCNLQIWKAWCAHSVKVVHLPVLYHSMMQGTIAGSCSTSSVPWLLPRIRRRVFVRRHTAQFSGASSSPYFAPDKWETVLINRAVSRKLSSALDQSAGQRER